MIQLCVYFIGELHKTFNIINKWNNKAGILKLLRIQTHKIAIGDNNINYPSG